MARKDKEKKTGVPLPRVVRIYVVPIVTLLVFTGLVLFLIIPKVSDVFAKLDDISAKDEEVRQADTMISQLQALSGNLNSIRSDLSKIDQIAPAGVTEVVKFQQDIIALARNNQLQVDEATLEESILTSDQGSVLGLIEIPSKFNVKGNLLSLQTFIEQIETLEDFVIIGEMSLRTNQRINESNLSNIANNDWTLLLTLVKYQFQIPTEQNRVLEAFRQIPPTAQPNARFLEFVRNRGQADVSQEQDSQEEISQ